MAGKPSAHDEPDHRRDAGTDDTATGPTADSLAVLATQMGTAGGGRVELQQGLAMCRERLVELGDAVAARIVPVTDAFLAGDVTAARDHAEIEPMVTAGCKALEDACLLLLARQSPVGADLRQVVAVIRSIGSVDRGAQLIVHVARSLTWVHPPSMPQRLREILRDLANRAAAVFQGGVDAARRSDGLAAVELQRTDDAVDLLHKELLSELYSGGQSTDESISLALIARYYERLGDHGVELARQVTFAVTGTRVPDEGR